VVPQILELAQLVEDHGVAQMKVGGGRIHAKLDAERPPAGDALDQFGLDQQFRRTLA